MENLSQRDIRWKDIKIGNSTSTIGNYGCTITCLAMLAGTTPDVVNAFLTAVDGFSVDRIIWSKINETKLGLHFPDMGRQYVYNDVAVREAIEKNGGCLVEVDYDGVVTTPSDRHWVLFIGNHQLIDPWTGTIRPTSSYPIVKGYAIIEKNNEQDDLTSSEENILRFLREQNADEGKVREAFGALTDKIALQAQIQTLGEKILSLESSHNDLQKQVDDLSLKLSEEEKSGAYWQSELKTANKEIEILKGQIEVLTKERNDYKRWYEKAKEDLRNLDKMTAWQHIRYGIKLLIKQSK